MKRDPSRALGPALRIAAAAVLLLALAALPQLAGAYVTEIGFRLLVYWVLAEGWNLLAGYGGLVSLGTSSFFGLGSYVAVGALNHLTGSLAAALLLAAIAGGVLAVIVSPAIFRLRGLYFTVGTLALAESLRLFVVNVPWFGGATGLFLDTDAPALKVLFVYAVGLLALASLALTACTASRFSVLLRAVRDDEDAASQMGVRPFRVKLTAFVLASMLMAAAGGLQAVKLGAIEPYGSFGLQWSIDALTIVIIGGMGLRLGPLVGAVFVVALGELLADYPEAHTAVTGAILILIIRFAPKGLTGIAISLMARLARTGRSSSALGDPSR